jgi:uncharacterized protein YcbX
MRGEEREELFLGFSGIYGDRFFAFTSAAAPRGFPYLTCREQKKMLWYQPRFRSPESASRPVNLEEAEKIAPGVTPVYAQAAQMMVDVQTPTGEVLSIDDPQLLQLLSDDLPGAPAVSLVCSDRALTDCRPVSIFSMQSAEMLGSELGMEMDYRRFRPNLYLDLPTLGGYGEQSLVGRTVRIGEKAVVAIIERDPRCKMITMDPDTGESDPAVLRTVAQAHSGTAGVYSAVLVEGMVRAGDPVELLN